MKGSAATRNTAAASQAATSLPAAISKAESRVAWRVARVPAERSPLMDVAVKAGAITKAMPSTKKAMMPKASGPAPYWL